MDDLQSDEVAAPTAREGGFAFGGFFAGGIALISAAACCVLPLVFISLGIGATTLAFLVPYHWPLTVIAGLTIAIGWLLYLKGGSGTGRKRSTLMLLLAASLFVILAAAWKAYLEAPLRTWLGA